MITDPKVEQLATGGRLYGPCTLIGMYGTECRVAGEGNEWFLEAPFSYMGAWDVWAIAESRDAALVLAGEYLREQRDHESHR